MDVFVRSRGYTEGDDYEWHSVLPEREEKVEGLTPVPYEQHGLGRLVSPEGESYVLSRYDQQLLLLAAGIPARERTDFISRTIRDSVLWVGSDEDEPRLRDIMIRVLERPSLLPDVLGWVIRFDDRNRFQTSLSELDAYTKPSTRQNEIGSRTSRIRVLSSATRKELAHELKSVRLPQRQGVLVAVTEVGSVSDMREIGVWRGLASGMSRQRAWYDEQRKFVPPVPEREQQRSRLFDWLDLM